MEETKVEWWFSGTKGRGKWEVVFNGFWVWVLQDENVLELDGGDGSTQQGECPSCCWAIFLKMVMMVSLCDVHFTTIQKYYINMWLNTSKYWLYKVIKINLSWSFIYKNMQMYNVTIFTSFWREQNGKERKELQWRNMINTPQPADQDKHH